LTHLFLYNANNFLVDQECILVDQERFMVDQECILVDQKRSLVYPAGAGYKLAPAEAIFVIANG
jgi:hypothetical protein